MRTIKHCLSLTADSKDISVQFTTTQEFRDKEGTQGFLRYIVLCLIHCWCFRKYVDHYLWVMANCMDITAVFESSLNGVARFGMRSHKAHWGRVSKTLAILLSLTEWLCLAMKLETFTASLLKKKKYCSTAKLDNFVIWYAVYNVHGLIIMQTISNRQSGSLVDKLSIFQVSVGEDKCLRSRG